MASAISNSTSISLTSGVSLITRKNKFFPRCSILRNHNKQLLSVPKHSLPLSTSLKLFPQFRIGCSSPFQLKTCIAFATGTDVVVEEADLSAADNEASVIATQASEIAGELSAKSNADSTKSKRPRAARKSDMPAVKNEELIPGASFTGKVRSIQPFGAFIDFGAFTDGLVHVSRLSDGFVKDVSAVVTVGQEVTVKLIEANMDTGRISLSMRDSVDDNRGQQKDTQSNRDSDRPPRKTGQKFNQKKEDGRKRSKFVKGQDLEGVVKNLTRAGAFITLPEGEEGFLPSSEEADEGFVSLMGGSSLEIGQEVSVRVLRISRGQVTLTMKKEEDAAELDSKLSKGGVVHTATNPFVLAFRNNSALSDFLDERKNEEEPRHEEQDSNNAGGVNLAYDTLTSSLDEEEKLEILPDSSQSDDIKIESLNEVEADSVLPRNDESLPFEDQIIDELSPEEDKVIDNEGEISGELPDSSSLTEGVEESLEKVKDDVVIKDEGQSQKLDSEIIAASQSESEASEEISDQLLTSAIAEEVIKNETDEIIAENEGENEKPEGTITSEIQSEQEITEEVVITNETDEIIAENEGVNEKPEGTITSDIQSEQETATPNPEEDSGASTILAGLPEGQVSNEAVEDLEADKPVNELELQISAENNESSESTAQHIGEVVNPTGDIDSSEKETTAKASISPAFVKQLREETGAGMMDCKKALSETGGDIIKAQEYLRKKGLASADKKASRATAEGRIGSYIHDGRIGVLIEVNCETDFVARGDIFKELVEDLGMQVAACPQVQYLSTEDVPKEIVDREKELEMQREDLLSKPEQIRAKIVEGRIGKRLQELALVEQPFIKDDKIVVKDWVKQTISTVGENIKVKRFTRYNLGEGLEKKSQDFAAEVAAQTAAKPASTSVKQEVVATDTKGITDEAPKPIVSAALVKQLREETGAGMMECKKALSESGGDLEKAQEYLRKKGLSTADKKSSRLAAEGRIGSYIHDSRIGVLIEVNCETDFVGRSQDFKQLVDDLGMQVVASPLVQYVSIEDIPESIINKEKEIEMQREDLQSKPENIREKIVEGRIAKSLGVLSLLDQPFIKNDSLLVKDWIKQTVATLGENIKVRRFIRFTLGETKTENEA